MTLSEASDVGIKMDSVVLFSSLKLIKNRIKRSSSLSKFGHVIGLQYFEQYHPDLDGVSQMVFTPSLPRLRIAPIALTEYGFSEITIGMNLLLVSFTLHLTFSQLPKEGANRAHNKVFLNSVKLSV